MRVVALISVACAMFRLPKVCPGPDRLLAKGSKIRPGSGQRALNRSVRGPGWFVCLIVIVKGLSGVVLGRKHMFACAFSVFEGSEGRVVCSERSTHQSAYVRHCLRLRRKGNEYLML